MQYNVLHGGGRMAFSIRLTEDERALAESYAKLGSNFAACKLLGSNTSCGNRI